MRVRDETRREASTAGFVGYDSYMSKEDKKGQGPDSPRDLGLSEGRKAQNVINLVAQQGGQIPTGGISASPPQGEAGNAGGESPAPEAKKEE